MLAAWLALGLGLQAESVAAEEVNFSTDEGTWMSVDVTRDGRALLFDMLGDIYRLDSGGGSAQPLISGPAFDTQPVLSPAGVQIAFISDRSGSENVWIADVTGANARALSDDLDAVFVAPVWSADGRDIYVTRFDSRSRLDAKTKAQLWRLSVSGGKGEPAVAAAADNAPVFAASVSADGRFLYGTAAGGRGKYDIVRLDLTTNESIVLISGRAYASGVMQPVVSPDGAVLIYAVDVGGRTELRVRELRSGDDRVLIPAIETSFAKQTPAFQGLLPRFAFTPDSKALVIAFGGRIRRIELASGEARIVPFTATVQAQVTASPRPLLRDEAGPVRARIIQAPQLSPDGKQVAFSAFGKLYVASLPRGKARRLTDTALIEAGVTENQPSWSADGRWIVYASWSRRDGGHIWKVPSTGDSAPEQLTQLPGYYRKPTLTPDGRSVIALYSATYDQLNLLVPRGGSPERPGAQQLVRLLSSGEREVLANLPPTARRADHGRLHFMPDRRSLLAYTSKGLMQVPVDGGPPRKVLEVQAVDVLHSQTAVDELEVSPDGRWALVLQGSQLHLLAMPSVELPEPIDLASPPGWHRQITEIGADEFGWSANGKEIFWSVGTSLFRAPLDRLLQPPAATLSATDEDCADTRFARVDLDVSIARDRPSTQMLLRGAKVATMRGDEIIARADVLIRGNRIAAVGPMGSVATPATAIIHDFAGKTITPGFADTHAHYWRIGRQVLDYDSWEHRIALAYGITTSIDPQSFTNDMFVYQDLMDAGVMRGPRAYTTGPGIFDANRIGSVRQASCILRRYRDHYRTPIVKSYMIGNRAQRQQMAQAARKLQMMLIAENWGVPRYALTQAMDGFATNEHASDAIDYYNDVAQLYARTGIGYSPTTLIGGAAGLPGINYFLARRDLLTNAKLNYFTPSLVVNERLRSVTWQPDDWFIGSRLAASASKIFRAGGNVGVGGHSEVQGLGYHWELQTMAMGGLTPHEVLQMATRGSATVIGRSAEVGTIEPGKYADLIVFERDPLLDIAATETISHVMKNGRLYRADTLREMNTPLTSRR